MANMNQTVEFKAVSSKDSTKYVVLKGFYVTETLLNVTSVLKSAAFLADELAKETVQKKFQLGNSVQTSPTLPSGYHEGMQPFVAFTGMDIFELDIKTWAITNGYTLFKEGVDISGPILIDISINAARTVVTFTFNKNINNNLVDNAAIKAATTITLTGGLGGTFVALQAGDSVTTPNGAAATYAVTLVTPLVASATANAIKIAAGTFRDAQTPALTNAAIGFVIDSLVPASTFIPAGSATGVSRSIDGIKIAFAERLYLVSTHAPLKASDLTAANVIFKLTNSGGADVPCVRTIAPDGKSINIAPSSLLAGTQAYYVAITTGFEDAFQNAIAAANATWTTIA